MNKMNKKGEVGIGMIVISFVGIIVALALLNPIVDTTGDMTTTREIINLSITTAAVNGTVTLPGRENITVITVQNESEDFTDNFAVVTRNSGGGLAILLKTLDSAADANIDEGLELVEKALELKPDNCYYLDTKGWGLYKQAKYEEAYKVLKDAWESRPMYVHVRYMHLQEVEQALASQNQ